MSNWNAGWQRHTWGELSLFATGVGKETVSDGNSRSVINQTTSVPLMGIFKMDVITSPATGKSVTQLSVDVGASLGLGLILQGEAKFPFYRIRE